VAAVDLFGNPHFHPRQAPINIGDFNPRLAGVFFATPSDSGPGDWVPLTNSYCMGGDPVCNFNARNATRCAALLAVGQCVHQCFPNAGWTRSAADAAAGRWRWRTRLR
jgi:hypothetical protein